MQQIKNKPGIYTYTGTTLINTACAAANASNFTLVIVYPITNMQTQTISCNSLEISPGGLLQVGFGQTLTMTPNFSCGTYQQCFDTTTLGGSIVFAGTNRPTLRPVWFGADWKGVNDSAPAIKATYASSNSLYFDGGVYNLISDQFVISRNGFNVTCEPGKTLIEYTGTGTVDSVVKFNTVVFNKMSDCILAGNSHSSSVFLENSGGNNTFSNLIAYNTNSSGSCFKLLNGDTNTLIAPYSTSDFPVQSQVPCTVGLDIQEGNDTIITPLMKEMSGSSGIGIKFSGTFCSGNTIVGGAIEGNLTAGSLASTCAGNLLYNVDFEANTTNTVTDAGSGNHFIGAGTSLYHLTSTAKNTVIDGTSVDGITVDSGAKNVTLINNTFNNNNVVGITDNGTGTTLINNTNANGGNKFTEKIGGMVTTTPGIPSTQSSLFNSLFIGLGGASVPTGSNSSIAEGISGSNGGSITLFSASAGLASNTAFNAVQENTGSSINGAIVANNLVDTSGNQITIGRFTEVYLWLISHDFNAGANTLTINGATYNVYKASSTGTNLTIAQTHQAIVHLISLGGAMLVLGE